MDEWQSMTLGEAGVALIDCVHKTPAAVEVGYPYIAIPQMRNGRIDFSGARQICHADFIEWTKKARPQVHDVVLSRRTNPGVTATFGKQCEFAVGQNLVLLRADGRFVRPEFLRWLVVSPAWWSQIKKYNNVGAIFDSHPQADLRKRVRRGAFKTSAGSRQAPVPDRLPNRRRPSSANAGRYKQR
jgi:type I restriction enzyme, S subunit